MHNAGNQVLNSRIPCISRLGSCVCICVDCLNTTILTCRGYGVKLLGKTLVQKYLKGILLVSIVVFVNSFGNIQWHKFVVVMRAVPRSLEKCPESLNGIDVNISVNILLAMIHNLVGYLFSDRLICLKFVRHEHGIIKSY